MTMLKILPALMLALCLPAQINVSLVDDIGSCVLPGQVITVEASTQGMDWFYLCFSNGFPPGHPDYDVVATTVSNWGLFDFEVPDDWDEVVIGAVEISGRAFEFVWLTVGCKWCPGLGVEPSDLPGPKARALSTELPGHVGAREGSRTLCLRSH